MIPYVPPPVIELGGVRLHAFGVMVGLTLLVGCGVFLNRARRQGLTRVCPAFYPRRRGGRIRCGPPDALRSSRAPCFSSAHWIGPAASIRSAGSPAAGSRDTCSCWSSGSLRRIGACTSTTWPSHSLSGGSSAAPDSAWLTTMWAPPGRQSWRSVSSGAHTTISACWMPFTCAVAALFVWLDRKPQRRGFYLALFLFSYGVFLLWRDTLEVRPGQGSGISLDSVFAAACLVGGVWYALLQRRGGRGSLRCGTLQAAGAGRTGDGGGGAAAVDRAPGGL